MKRRLLAALFIPSLWAQPSHACVDHVLLQSLVPAGLKMLDWPDVPADRQRPLLNAISALSVFLDEEGTRTNTGGLVPLSPRSAHYILSSDQHTRYSKLVVNENFELVAMLLANSDDSMHIYKLAVVPSHRGQQLGTIMLAATALRVQEAGQRQMGLHVFSNNTPALKLYDSLGFKIVDTMPSIKPPAQVHALYVEPKEVLPRAFKKLVPAPSE